MLRHLGAMLRWILRSEATDVRNSKLLSEIKLRGQRVLQELYHRLGRCIQYCKESRQVHLRVLL
jgi:hypothetical protein